MNYRTEPPESCLRFSQFYVGRFRTYVETNVKEQIAFVEDFPQIVQAQAWAREISTSSRVGNELRREAVRVCIDLALLVHRVLGKLHEQRLGQLLGWLDDAILVVSQNGDESLAQDLGWLIARRGDVLTVQKQAGEAFEQYESALKHAEDSRSVDLEVYCKRRLADLHLEGNRWFYAELLYRDILERSDSQQRPHATANAFHGLGSISYERAKAATGDDSDASEFFAQASFLFGQAADYARTAGCYSCEAEAVRRQAHVFGLTAEYAKAAYKSALAAELFAKVKSPPSQARCLLGHAHALQSLGRYVEARRVAEIGRNVLRDELDTNRESAESGVLALHEYLSPFDASETMGQLERFLVQLPRPER